MRKRELNFFRLLLEARRRDILAEGERALGKINCRDEEACADPSDRASLESDRNFVLRMRDRERKLLAKIDEAFARIDNGTYGRCEECADQIGLERLKARPVTTLCISCKSLQEARERQGFVR